MYIPLEPLTKYTPRQRNTYTDWTTGPPPCEGVWRVRMGKDEGLYCYWTVKYGWGLPALLPTEAVSKRYVPSWFQDREWFGLTFQPLESLYAME